jgi:hypothetical protein
MSVSEWTAPAPDSARSRSRLPSPLLRPPQSRSHERERMDRASPGSARSRSRRPSPILRPPHPVAMSVSEWTAPAPASAPSRSRPPSPAIRPPQSRSHERERMDRPSPDSARSRSRRPSPLLRSPHPVAMSVSEWTPPAAATSISPRPVAKPRDPRRRWRRRADLPSAGGPPRRHGRHHDRKTPEERPTEPTEFTERDRIDPPPRFREIP